MFDKNVNIGSNNRAGRDQVINIYNKAIDYKRLANKLTELERKQEKLVQRIRKYPDDEEFKQDLLACNAELADTRKEIEDFKAEVFRLHELFTRIPINTERLRRAKEHFEKGEFREADAVLKAEEIERDVERLKNEQAAAKDKLAAIEQSLADRANEFLLKAQLSLVTPLAEGEDRFRRTEGYFTQALAAARTAEVLFAYAKFLQEHNAFSKAEPLYQEALQQRRRDAETDQRKFLPKVANILNNLAILHTRTQDYGLALKEFEEALKLYRCLAEAEPKAFLPKVAMTLNNLAALHYQAEEHDTALNDYEKALEIRRSLAKTEPKVFFPDVAATLNNIANLYAQAENYGIALKEYKKALKLYRCLAKTEPKVFLLYVATTLNNLAVLRQRIYDYDPALKEFEEALKIRRNLAETEPKAFLPDVAMTLNNLAILHSITEEYGSALKEYEEALKLYRSLAKIEPRAFNQALTETLINLSIFYLEDVPDKAKSVAYAQEARSILIPLCKQVPHLQQYLDKAERLLAENSTAPVSTPVK